MRCQRARKWMTAAVDGELSPRRRRALDGHLAACAACRRELAVTERMLTALEGLPMEAAVSARLEQATLRRVRLAAADEAERAPASRWTRWLPLPAFALATAAVLVLAIGIVRRTGQVPGAPAVRPAPKLDARGVAQAPPSLLRPPRRFAKLPKQRQKNRERRYQQFRDMPPQERQRLRQNYDTYRGLPPRQRQEFIDKYHRWKGRK